MGALLPFYVTASTFLTFCFFFSSSFISLSEDCIFKSLYVCVYVECTWLVESLQFFIAEYVFLLLFYIKMRKTRKLGKISSNRKNVSLKFYRFFIYYLLTVGVTEKKKLRLPLNWFLFKTLFLVLLFSFY